MVTKKPVAKSWDSEENEAQNNFFKWGEVGDYILGTLVSKKQVPSTLPDRKGEMQWIYEVKVREGEYHELDAKGNATDEIITLDADDIISVGGRSMYDSRMARVKIGQVFGLKFTEELEVTTLPSSSRRSRRKAMTASSRWILFSSRSVRQIVLTSRLNNIWTLQRSFIRRAVGISLPVQCSCSSELYWAQ